MTDLVELELPASGRSYLSRVLQPEGGLCGLMRETVCSDGSYFAIVPAGTSVARAEQFAVGGLMSASAAENELIARVLKHSGLLIIQDLWANPKDYEDHSVPANVWVCGGKVYLWIELNSESGDQIQSLLRHPISWYYVVCLIRHDSAAQKLRSGSASIEDLAGHVTEIYVPAYDQESFVMWVR